MTVEHLLAHTAGFPRAPMRPEEGADRSARVERMATWRMDWPAGHPDGVPRDVGVLGARRDGRPHHRVGLPHGLRGADRASRSALDGLTLGAAAGAQDGIARIRAVGDADGETLGDHVKETGEEFLLRFNEPEVMAAGVPGAGAVAPRGRRRAVLPGVAAQRPARWLDRDVLADATAHVRNRQVDPLFSVPANRTLGLVVAGDDEHSLVRGFGRGNSPRAFGAQGVGGQIAWADPALRPVVLLSHQRPRRRRRRVVHPVGEDRRVSPRAA